MPAWTGDELIEIQAAILPDDVRIELEWGEIPFYVWARVNIAAKSADEVRPHDFRICIASEAGLRDFDSGEVSGL